MSFGLPNARSVTFPLTLQFFHPCKSIPLTCSSGARITRRKWHSSSPFRRGVRTNRFSTTTEASSLESTASAQSDPSIESVLIHRDGHAGIPGAGSSASGRNIREELKRWSVQNEQFKQDNAPETIPASGRIDTLPRSFFMPELKNEEDDDDIDDFDDLFQQREGLGEDAAGGVAYENLDVGDLTLALRAGSASFSAARTAIFLGEVNFTQLFLLANGTWASLLPSRQFPKPVIKGFASEEEVDELRKFLPTRAIEVERMAGETTVVDFVGGVIVSHDHPLKRRMEALLSDVDTFRRDNIPLLDTIHERFAHETNFVSLTVAQVMERTLGPKATPAAKWATNMAMAKDIDRMVVRPYGTSRDTNVVTFLPKKFLRQSEMVSDWARQYQEAAAQGSTGRDVSKALADNPITSFIERSRRIILASRKIRSPTTTGALGPSRYQQFTESGQIESRPNVEPWSETDKMILYFIWDQHCRSPVSLVVTRSAAIASLILRAIGAYPKMQLSRDIGRLFLMEVGSLAPFDSARKSTVQAPIANSRGANEVAELHSAADALAKDLGFEPGSRHIPMPDTLRDIRKDLGDMLVVCIDSVHTVTLDDGISLEPCPDNPGSYWIHIHVAHPTAFFDRDHLFGRLARLGVLTFYDPTAMRPVPMLPDVVTQVLSLKEGGEAFTVSTLLKENGEVQDTKVHATRIQNLVRLDDRTVNEVLGKIEKERALLIVGSDPRLTPHDKDAPSAESIAKARKHLPLLEKINSLLEARVRARAREVPERYNGWELEVLASAKVLGVDDLGTQPSFESRHHLGDPTIKISALVSDTVERRHERQLDYVEQCMGLASESLGKWCRDRNIPVTYRGWKFSASFDIARLNKMEPTLSFKTPKAVVRTEPIFNHYFHTKQYVSATSPLRRYNDMVPQWNMNAYLLAEADGKIEPGSRLPDGFEMPWSTADLQDYIDNELWKVKSIQSTNLREADHFRTQALFRAFHFHEAKLPEIWDVKVIMTSSQGTKMSRYREDFSGVVGTLLPFNLRVNLLQTEEGWVKQARRGQYLACKLLTVDPVHMLVDAVPVGPPSDVRTQNGPFVIWSLAGKEAGTVGDNSEGAAGRAAVGVPPST